MRSIAKLTAVVVLGLLVAGCGGGAATTRSTTGSPTTVGSHGAPETFASGYLKFEQATNLLGTTITPLEDNITASSGNATRMSRAFVALGKSEKSLAEDWHPALVAFEALTPPPTIATIFAATTGDARRVYATLVTISTVADVTSATLTPRQFIAGGKDLRAFATQARALAADLEKLDHRLGVS